MESTGLKNRSKNISNAPLLLSSKLTIWSFDFSFELNDPQGTTLNSAHVLDMMSDVFLSSYCFKSYLRKIPFVRVLENLAIELIIARGFRPTVKQVVIKIRSHTYDHNSMTATPKTGVAAVIRVDGHSYSKVVYRKVLPNNSVNYLMTNHFPEEIKLGRVFDGKVIEPYILEVGVLRSGRVVPELATKMII